MVVLVQCVLEMTNFGTGSWMATLHAEAINYFVYIFEWKGQWNSISERKLPFACLKVLVTNPNSIVVCGEPIANRGTIVRWFRVNSKVQILCSDAANSDECI